MAKKKLRERKGSFSSVGLPVSESYVIPRSRRRMVVIGFIGLAAAIVWAIGDFYLGSANVMSSGPLSSSHAFYEGDDQCGQCHADVTDRWATAGMSWDTLGEIPSDKCSDCHEKGGDELGWYSYGAHYLYRSARPSRIAEARDEHQVFEGECYTCHTEHQGRDAMITAVGDQDCAVCHFEAFADHPEFQFLRDETPDDDTLRFPHIKHLRLLKERARIFDLEQACLYCHNPDRDGKNFQPISFDIHCDACHLDVTAATKPAPVAPGSRPGVETIEAIERRGGLGTFWTRYSNPDDFRTDAGGVFKRPVVHKDPWVLWNLRWLRTLALGREGADAGGSVVPVVLADLLESTPTDRPEYSRRMYRDALETLELYADELRSRPVEQVQDELRSLREVMRKMDSQIRDRSLDLNLEVFRLGEPAVPAGELSGLQAVTDKLVGTASPASTDESAAAALRRPCLECHRLETFTIVRVNSDLDELRRAEFDHRAHVIHADCVDCHGVIPMEDYFENINRPIGDDVKTLDRATTHNLPDIDSCGACHSPRRSDSSCLTCHMFHPDKDRYAQLLRYADFKEASRDGETGP